MVKHNVERMAMNEREKFEAFARSKGWNLCRSANSDDYAFAVASGAWAAWQAALAAPAAQTTELAVWCGPMPESNGRQNWTAVLYRKANGIFGEGHMCIEQSEYPDRVRYEADRLRYLIGERENEPDILKYDEKLHSGYGANDGGKKTRSLTFLQPDGDMWVVLERVYPLFGPPESGWVVNGGWYWRRVNGIEYAYKNERDTEPVNQWPARDWAVENDTIKIVDCDRDEDDDIPF